jgi:hypothetical protein
MEAALGSLMPVEFAFRVEGMDEYYVSFIDRNR